MKHTRHWLQCKQNRPPLCLRCKLEGHVRARCDTPFCTGCKLFGHRLLDCPGGTGYASAVRTGGGDDDADMDHETINKTDSMSDSDSAGDTLHIDVSTEWRKRNSVDSPTRETSNKNVQADTKKKIKLTSYG